MKATELIQRIQSKSSDAVFARLYGKAAVAASLLESGTYGLMLCDIMMPQMDGFQLLEIARKRAPGMPVVMATGYSTVDNAVEVMKSGAFDYIAKPFTPDQLTEKIQRALEQKSVSIEKLLESPGFDAFNVLFRSITRRAPQRFA